MNYNKIYDDETDTYYDINSIKGLVLLKKYTTLINENKRKKHKKKTIKLQIDKPYFNTKHTYTITSLGLMKYKLFNSKSYKKNINYKNYYEDILIYLLQLFKLDHNNNISNLYEYIYIIYKIKSDISKHYTLMPIDEDDNEDNEDDNEDNEDEDDNDSTDESIKDTNILNIQLLIDKYNKKYTYTSTIISFIMNSNNAFMLYNVHNLLDIHIYKQTIQSCIKKNFITVYNKI